MLNETSAVHQYAYGESGNPAPTPLRDDQQQDEQPPATTPELAASEQATPVAERKPRTRKAKSKNKYGGKTDPRWSPEARAKRAESMRLRLAGKRKAEKPTRATTKAAKPPKAKKQKRVYTKRANGAAASAAEAMIAAATSTTALSDLPPMLRPIGRPKGSSGAPRASQRTRTDGGDHATALVLIRLALDLLQR